MIAFAIALAVLSGTPAIAAELAERDARAARAVVEAQLAAFAADDAETAFSFATQAMRLRFGNSADFMAMVRAGYPMVIKPAAAAFFIAVEADGVVIQKVHLRDAEGNNWLAIYQVVRDGAAWRIAGCAVARETAQSKFL